MKYAKVVNWVVEKYPYTFTDLRLENPDISFPAQMPDELLALHNMHPVFPMDPPEVPPLKDLAEVTPTRNGGTFYQTWALVDPPEAEIQRRQEIIAQSQELDLAKLDAWIVAYLGMTPAGAQAYIEANSPTLAALRTNVARLAYAVRVLIRREFNA